MGSQRLVALVGAITIAIASCSSEDTTTPTASAPSPSPVTTPIPKAATVPATQPLNAPNKQGTPPVAGLIQPTNAEERRRQVESEIKNDTVRNPFVGLPPALPKATSPVKPVPNVTQLPGTQAGSPNAPGTTPGGTQPPANRPNSPIASGPLIPPISLKESPTLPQAEDAPLGFNVPPTLPAPPSTAAASAIEVTGVVIVGRSPQAIVVVPGDPGSRYVGVGQRISGGKVLVKRIEMAAGSDPIVILEENGVEVARGVGEKSAAPAKQAANQVNQVEA